MGMENVRTPKKTISDRVEHSKISQFWVTQFLGKLSILIWLISSRIFYIYRTPLDEGRKYLFYFIPVTT